MWVGLALALLCGGCIEAPPSTADASITERYDPQWAGCVDVGRAGCRLIDPTLVVWLPDEHSWTWTLDEHAVEPTREHVADGTRFTFDVSALDEPASLRLHEGEAAAWALELLPRRLEPENLGRDVVEGLRADAPEARNALANELLAEPTGDPANELLRIHVARRLRFDARDPGGSIEAMLPLLEREGELAGMLGAWDVRCEAALVGLFIGTQLERPPVVERWRDLESECRARAPGLAGRFDHHLGTHARHVGHYEDAERRLDRATATALRLQPHHIFETELEKLDLYVRTARWSSARTQIERLDGLGLSACDRALSGSEVGFARVRARQGGGDLGDPRPGLHAALNAHETMPCKNVTRAANDRLKLGYAAALDGDGAALRTIVESLSTAKLSGKHRLQHAELQMQLAVFEQRYDEVPGLLAQLDDALDRGEPEARWRVWMVAADAAERSGDVDRALAAYASAEAVLDTLWRGVGSDSLRARWLASFRRSAIGAMKLHRAQGNDEAAACAARRARLRALLPPQSAPCDRTWARRADEAVFLIVPADDRWSVFIVEDDRVVEATDVVPPSSEHEGWWDPWDDVLARARRVRILAAGEALMAPLHRTHWRGAPLLRTRPVTYGLDLPPQTPRSGVPTASIVFSDADPLRTLGRYRDELRALQTPLASQGWTTRWLDTPTSEAMTQQGAPADGLLLYYGHGMRVGLEGQARTSDAVGSTALRLRDDALWGPADVAALEHPPRWAVLLGCEVGAPDASSWRGGLNVAHAMLLEGTDAVLASPAPIDARAAAGLGHALLTSLDSNAFDLAEAWHVLWARQPPSGLEADLQQLRIWSR